MDRTETCATCRHWQPPLQGEVLGACHRHNDRWPPRCPGDWCGEWAPWPAPQPQADAPVLAERSRCLALVVLARDRVALDDQPSSVDWLLSRIDNPSLPLEG